MLPLQRLSHPTPPPPPPHPPLPAASSTFTPAAATEPGPGPTLPSTHTHTPPLPPQPWTLVSDNAPSAAAPSCRQALAVLLSLQLPLAVPAAVRMLVAITRCPALARPLLAALDLQPHAGGVGLRVGCGREARGAAAVHSLMAGLPASRMATAIVCHGVRSLDAQVQPARCSAMHGGAYQARAGHARRGCADRRKHHHHLSQPQHPHPRQQLRQQQQVPCQRRARHAARSMHGSRACASSTKRAPSAHCCAGEARTHLCVCLDVHAFACMLDVHACMCNCARVCLADATYRKHDAQS